MVVVCQNGDKYLVLEKRLEEAATVFKLFGSILAAISSMGEGGALTPEGAESAPWTSAYEGNANART